MLEIFVGVAIAFFVVMGLIGTITSLVSALTATRGDALRVVAGLWGAVAIVFSTVIIVWQLGHVYTIVDKL